MGNRQRIVLTRLVTGSILLFLLLRYTEETSFSGLRSPSLFSMGMDVSYWLYKLSGLPALLVHNRTGAIIADLLLFGTGILSFLFPLRRIWVVGFSVLLILYVLTFNTYATDHLAQVAGFMVVLLPFWVRDDRVFWLAWEGMRYFTCWVYVAAFLWKTCINNSFWYLGQGADSFKKNLFDYMYLNPDAVMTGFYRWCIRHDWVLNGGEKFIALLEGVMLIGFFTKRYDRLLIWVPVVIHVSTYFFSDVFFIELLVIDLSFLSRAQLDRIGRWFGGLSDGGKPGRKRTAI
jgi:hypothetical protein